MSQFNDQMLKRIFWVLSAIVFLYMVMIVPHYGISGDGVTQYNYGTHVWNYIKTFGENKTVLTDEYILKKELQYYGGFFDGFAAMLIDVFQPKDEYLLRHYWCMLFGFIGILSSGLLAKELGGWRAGILAIIFLFFTARYFGESFNNPKDPPFAATYILALYAMVIWLKNLENLKWKHSILLGLAIALCLSIRIGGLLLVAYLGLFYLITVWQKKLYKEKAFSNSIKHLIVTGLIGYIVAILWWPYALEAPLTNPLQALKVMSSYPLFVKMLFEGQRIDTSQVPWYYLPKWLGMGLPIYLLLGFIGGCILVVKMSRFFKAPYIWMIIFSALFPVLYILYKHSVLYDGLRHVLFIVPSMVVIASLFYVYVGDQLKGKGAKYALAGLVLVLVALPARFMFANHPNEYVYFNELSGGIKAAYGEYETDYYMNSVKQGFEWLKKNELSKSSGKDTIVIATNCIEPFYHYIKFSPTPVSAIYSRYYQKNQQDWDYAVYFSRFLDKEQLINGYFPSELAIHVIEADGVPLCAILKNDPERAGYRGYVSMQKGDTANAVRLLTRAAQKYPKDMELWTNLGMVYITSGNLVAAQAAMDRAMSISSLDIQTASIAGEIALRSNNGAKATQIYSAMTENYPTMADGYFGLAKAQALQGSFDLAIGTVNSALEMASEEAEKANNPGIYYQAQQQGNMTLAIIYQMKGDMATAQRYYQAAQGGR